MAERTKYRIGPDVTTDDALRDSRGLLVDEHYAERAAADALQQVHERGRDIPQLQVVTLATDGSCLGNPGPGGWAAILVHGEYERELGGGEANTTNNRMELTAILEGLKALKRPVQVEVETDSQDAVKWLTGLQRQKNSEVVRLCAAINDAVQTAGHVVHYEHVRGHAGHPLNERANRIAQRWAERFKAAGGD